MQKNALFLLYLSGLFVVALYPFDFAPGPLLPRLPEFFQQVYKPNFNLFTRDFFLNVLLFVPLGAFLEMRLRPKLGRGRKTIFLVTITGFLVTAIVEFTQLFFHNRHSSAIDLATNTAGTFIGAMLVAWLDVNPALPRPLLQCWEWTWRLIFLGCAVLAAVPLALPIVYPRWHSMEDWSDRPRLHLGNQPNLERPWYGKFHSVAIYDRAFDQGMARERFLQMGSRVTWSARNYGKSPLVLYELGTAGPEALKDRSGNGADLGVEGRGRIRWDPTEPGLRLRHPVRLSTTSAAGRRLTQALQSTGEITVEAWIAPNNVVQRGPNPIVAFGAGRRNASFLLGQDCKNLVFWLRTPATGRRYGTLALRTRTNPLTTELTHVVASFRDGRQELFVNGALAARFDIRREAMFGLFAFRSNAARLAHAVVFFVPLAVVWTADRLRRGRKSAVLPVWSATVGLLVIAELVQAWTGGRAIDFWLIVTGGGVVAVAVIAAGARATTSAEPGAQVRRTGTSIEAGR